MPQIRARLAAKFHDLALSVGMSAWCAHRQNVRRILMIHRVGPHEELTAEGLEHGLQWLSSRFRLVSLGELIDGVATGSQPRGEIALTFDDGLRCQLEHAYPVLVRCNAPATFFVCPGLIESRKWLWNHEARARLQRLDAPSLAHHAANWGTSATGIDGIIHWMKTLDPSTLKTVESRIRLATPDFLPSDEERARFEPLTWTDLSRLDPGLVTIGSHTLSHPILPTLEAAALERELRESRALLEEQLDRTVDLFCYPNGSMDERVRAAAARAYNAAVVTEPGHVQPDADLFGLRRIGFPDRLSLLAWRIHRP